MFVKYDLALFSSLGIAWLFLPRKHETQKSIIGENKAIIHVLLLIHVLKYQKAYNYTTYKHVLLIVLL
jgi:hypothetical protein